MTLKVHFYLLSGEASYSSCLKMKKNCLSYHMQ